MEDSRRIHSGVNRLVIEPDEGYAFLHEFGEPFSKNRLTDMVKKYLRAAGVAKPGAAHLVRHAMATHMLENGADIRFIQRQTAMDEKSPLTASPS